MNRHALRSALGRGTPSSSSSTAAARALSLPISTTTPTSFFSTTPSRPAADENNNNNSKPRSQNAAVERLTQLNNNNNNRGTGGGPKKETLDSIPSLSSSSSSTRGGGGFRPGSGIIDARSLRVSPAEGASSSLSATAPRLVWSPEEKAVMDRLDQGEMVPFDPKLTLDSLSGYGAALATDAPIGQVESALRAMRLMTGGMAFNAESGVTADVKAIIERYKQKKPVFVHSKEEKAWIESSQPRLRLVGPNAETKKAIVDTAILGQYKGTTFAEAGDVKATMANYHARTFTYMASDSQKFMDKVISLLPAQGGGKPAAQAPKP
ncbi:hypothetical protein C8A00DRAFT_11368 [Chaetomidium leptoderma]|uniref:Uncharacterized protein n=1 Tax=Chaetomidium leptoderma TaxID=669021 RepID=A0AAN6VXA2_9PEZI|nr:hypothetical protein C8A00DRAFT_11368 [Chaetomidium leptoderma]